MSRLFGVGRSNYDFGEHDALNGLELMLEICFG